MTLQELEAYGANVQEGLGRCMGMEAFYLKLVETIKTEAGFDNLKNAIEANDLDAAFEAAHALKGVLSNLALTPMQEPVMEITELLRARTEMDYSELLGQILDEWERFKAL